MDELTEPCILIEWPEQEGIDLVAKHNDFTHLKEESQKAIHIAMSSMRVMADKVSRTIHEMEADSRPDEVKVEFGLKLEAEGGAVFPMVAKTTAGGQFTISFKWTIEKPLQAKVQAKAIE
jgi:hypothetical protein